MRMSIIMTPYQREQQLAWTLDSIKRQGRDVEIIIVPDDRDHSQQAWLNPAPLLNEATRQSTGDVIIQQNAECKHINAVLEAFAGLPRGEAWFASCMALNEDGSEDKWYCHPTERREPWFFCGAIWKADMLEYDESFTEYGYEDKDLSDRLEVNGIKFRWLEPSEALVHHQWHPRFKGSSNSRQVYEQKRHRNSHSL